MLPEGHVDSGMNQPPRACSSATLCFEPLSADCHKGPSALSKSFLSIKSAFSPRNTCVSSYYFHSYCMTNMPESPAHFTLPALPTQDNQPHESPPFTPAALPV